ncbi:octopine/nopaline transport system substrate-binding protein [Rhizobiales bacterium GAS191]|nr:octopine/nopaline transport system substrate-binding protein [Rhizobiales bacterium GAS191]
MKLLKTGLVLGALLSALAVGGQAAAQESPATLHIGTDGGYLPWTATTASGELIGFDIDVAKLACERMKRVCRFTAQPWEGQIPALEQGKYQLLVGGISITAERKKRLAFTQSYGNLSINFAAPKSAGLNGKTTWAELKKELAGKVLGVQSGTQSQRFIDNELQGTATVHLYDNQDSLNLDLLAGRIDAALSGRSPWISLTRSPQGHDIEILSPNLTFEEFNYLGAGVGFLLRKDEPELTKQLDAALCALKAEGEISRISNKWFDFDISTPPDPAICGAKP